MKFKACSKCGALHTRQSKHRAVIAEGKAWCGHCGTKLEESLSPTGRRPSQPELQSLPPLKQAVQRFDQMTPERAKELLQQYRDTFPTTLRPGGFRNFPCVHVDLASGVDYSVAPKWETAMDKTPRHFDKSRYMKEALFAPYTATAKQVVQQERNGPNWGNMTPDDIYKDLAEVMNKVRTPAEQLIQHRLTQTWTIRDGKTVISYSPDNAVDIPVLLMTELLDNGAVEVVESWEGDVAVTQARHYLERFEARMKR